MDKVELVIKIDKDAYEARQHWVANPKKMIDKVDMAIANGTPLPKGHGNLVDTNELIENGVATESYLNTFIKTIIKADKEE